MHDYFVELHMWSDNPGYILLSIFPCFYPIIQTSIQIEPSFQRYGKLVSIEKFVARSGTRLSWKAFAPHNSGEACLSICYSSQTWCREFRASLVASDIAGINALRTATFSGPFQGIKARMFYEKTTMKGLVFVGSNNIEIQERPKPVIVEPTDAIVKLVKTTVCGKDCALARSRGLTRWLQAATCTSSKDMSSTFHSGASWATRDSGPLKRLEQV